MQGIKTVALKFTPALLLLLFSLGAGAEVYRWVDANGKVHFSDRKPSGQSDKDNKPDIEEISDKIDQTNLESSRQ